MYLILSSSTPSNKSFRSMTLYAVPDKRRSAIGEGTRELASATLPNDSIAEMMKALVFFNERIFADAVNHNVSSPEVLFDIDTVNPPTP